MTCEECKERVFELIEQEAEDPAGVHDLLARCPDCRALFDAMKEGLALAKRLPREEPSPEVDAALLRAASAQLSAGGPRRRWLEESPWAAAAIALLALSIGVWALPRTSETPAAPSTRPEEGQTRVTPAPMRAEHHGARPPTSRGSLEAEDTASRRSSADRAELRARKSIDVRERAPQHREAAAAASDAAVALTAEVRDVGNAEKQRSSLSTACQALRERIDALGAPGHGPEGSAKPEEALSLGRCYRDAGEFFEARRWFEKAASHPETKRRALRELRSLPER